MDGLSWFTQYNYLLSIIKGVPAIFPSFSHHFPSFSHMFSRIFSMIFHHVPSFSRDFPMLSKLSVSFRHRTNVGGWDLNGWARPVVAANLPLSWDSHGVAVPAEAHFFRENWYNGKNNVYIYILYLQYYCHYDCLITI